MLQEWDETIDYLVVGTGVAGLSAAITAKLNGLNTLVIESTDKWGEPLLSLAAFYGRRTIR
ncbi:MAG: FAD-binding protein [Mycobacterium sp.]|nr:FAD-binding protein [Mycobacterium sp.]